ncbi:MAG: sulfatase-like hydrolase/transferase, partial [Caldiserica bacterium]|nr:sulfatase-like hydrolase/transferase [Caldisericota bacterium]
MGSKKPNILLIFTDQQRADTIHALGNPVIKTPNLDKLVKSGVAFTSAYSPSPVCVPARCSMHYGQYPSNTNCYENSYEMPQDKESFMDALTRAGYRTHGIGKCHFTPDRHALRGFQTRETQEELVKNPDDDDYLKFLRQSGFSHITDPHGVRSEMYYIPQPAQMPAEYHPTQWVGDRGVQFLSEESRKSQPWFLFLSFVHPHPPFAVPTPWHKLYRAPLMPLPHVPPNVESLYTYINRVQNRYKYRDQGIDNNLLRCIKAYYYAAISFIDYQIGRILEMLEKTGEIDNT